MLSIYEIEKRVVDKNQHPLLVNPTENYLNSLCGDHHFEEENESAIPNGHKLRLLDSSDDNSESINQNSINVLDLSTNYVPTQVLI